MTKQLEELISSEIADFFAGVVEIHTELGGPNTVEEAQWQLTERVTRITSECEAALIAALEQSQEMAVYLREQRDEEERKAISNFEECASLSARLAELEASQLAVKLPDLNEHLIAILGRPNFTCSHLSELLRGSGVEIRRKSENEQAAVIHYLLNFYLEYGDKWESIVKEDIQSKVAALTASGTVQGDE